MILGKLKGLAHIMMLRCIVRRNNLENMMQITFLELLHQNI